MTHPQTHEREGGITFRYKLTAAQMGQLLSRSGRSAPKSGRTNEISNCSPDLYGRVGAPTKCLFQTLTPVVGCPHAATIRTDLGDSTQCLDLLLWARYGVVGRRRLARRPPRPAYPGARLVAWTLVQTRGDKQTATATTATASPWAIDSSLRIPTPHRAAGDGDKGY